MAKITIVGKQEWKTTDAKTGDEIEGLSYIGYLPNDKAIKFTSREEYTVNTGEVGFNPKLAIEINLITKLFKGEVRYQDGKSFGQDGQS